MYIIKNPFNLIDNVGLFLRMVAHYFEVAEGYVCGLKGGAIIYLLIIAWLQHMYGQPLPVW